MLWKNAQNLARLRESWPNFFLKKHLENFLAPGLEIFFECIPEIKGRKFLSLQKTNVLEKSSKFGQATWVLAKFFLEKHLENFLAPGLEIFFEWIPEIKVRKFMSLQKTNVVEKCSKFGQATWVLAKFFLEKTLRKFSGPGAGNFFRMHPRNKR